MIRKKSRSRFFEKTTLKQNDTVGEALEGK
jgi:hypothetical protein